MTREELNGLMIMRRAMGDLGTEVALTALSFFKLAHDANQQCVFNNQFALNTCNGETKIRNAEASEAGQPATHYMRPTHSSDRSESEEPIANRFDGINKKIAERERATRTLCERVASLETDVIKAERNIERIDSIEQRMVTQAMLAGICARIDRLESEAKHEKDAVNKRIDVLAGILNV